MASVGLVHNDIPKAAEADDCSKALCQSFAMATPTYELCPAEVRRIRWVVAVGTIGVLALAASMFVFSDASRPPLGAYVAATAVWCLMTVALVLRVHFAARKRSRAAGQ